MLSITRFEVNMFGELTYLLVDEATRECAIVDAGMHCREEEEAVDRYIADNGLKLTLLINTHLHMDHSFGINHLKRKYGVQLAANMGDQPYGDNFKAQLTRFGIKPEGHENVTIDRPLHTGDIIRIGDSSLEVIEVPGHTPGGIALYCKAQNFVLVGDSLFAGSIGRTDLPGGDHPTLIRAIREGLMTLPDDTTVLSGHGEPTTIGRERTHNPYL